MISCLLLLLTMGCKDKDSNDTSDTSDTSDADTDTDADTDSDTDSDADTDADTDADWSSCPDASAWVGDEAWTGQVVATEEAVYCGGIDESRTLEEELAAKAMLKVVAGTWKVPVEEGDYDFALPVCAMRSWTEPLAEVDGAGSTAVTRNTWSGTTYTYVRGGQPMISGSSGGWTLDHTLVLVGDEGATPEPLTLDGHANDPETGAGISLSMYPDGHATTIGFTPCMDPSWTKDAHTVTFDGGDVQLDLYLGHDISITAPAAFTRAVGTLDGTDFDVRGYFDLVYKADHHHFGRHFAVIFDEPINGACALRVEDIDPYATGVTATVSTADCDLSVLDTRTVTAQTSDLGG